MHSPAEPNSSRRWCASTMDHTIRPKLPHVPLTLCTATPQSEEHVSAPLWPALTSRGGRGAASCQAIGV